MQTALRVFVAAALSVLLLDGGCKENPIEPTNPREYSWSVQEITHPPGASFPFQVLATDIWGSSARDVYVTFLSGAVRQYKLFHFDGSTWSEVDVSRFGSSQLRFDLYAITGFSSTDIWAVGEHSHSNPNPPPNYSDSSLIIHFNGSAWSEMPVSFKQKGLRSIGAIASNDVWFGGYNRFLYRYNGISVGIDSLGSIFPATDNPGLVCSAISGRTINNLNAVFNDGSTGYFHFLGRSAAEWRELDSQFAWQTSLWVSPAGKVFSTFYGYGLYVWNGQAPWTPFHTEGNASTKVFGTSENNIFVTGQHGGIYHYNGLDWHHYKNLESSTINFSAIWTDGKEVFVIGNDGFKSYIYHGK